MEIPLIQRVCAVLWPSFLCAGAAAALFFTAFDPLYMFIEYDVSRLGAYTVGFFLLWALTALSSAATLYFLLRPKPGEVRQVAEPPAEGGG